MLGCGLDFGTSNSAIGVVRNGAPVLVPVDGEATLIPSAVFFDYERTGRIHFGANAIEASIAGADGRLMRALKTILGSPLIEERTVLGRERIALAQVVEIFIRHLKTKAETFQQSEISAVVHGRPVRFADDDAADAKAQVVLEAIARRAGFKDVVFVYEPIAAAYQYEATAIREELVLIADVGGGTSDFTVIRIGPQRSGLADRSSDVLASAGIRIGGTDFDTALSLEAVMPLLGRGTFLIEKNLPMPNGIYHELATWPTINFTYTRENERQLRTMVADAREPEKVSRLLKTIRDRLGHAIAFAVEDVKIAMSEAEAAMIPLGFIEEDLASRATRQGFDSVIEVKTERLHQAAARCIADAGLKPDTIGTVFFTGGSSRVPAVREAIRRATPEARLAAGSDLLSVASGLTREAARQFGLHVPPP